MKKIPITKYILCLVCYIIILCLCTNLTGIYYNKEVNELELNVLLVSVVLIGISSYNAINYTKRFFRGIFKKKKRKN